MANTTWNPADKSATVTLSLANLRATCSASSSGARGIASLSAGKYYWEYTYTTINTNSLLCGIALVSSSLATPTAGSAWVGRLGPININSINTGSSLGTIASGAVIGIAVDFTGQLIWFRVSPSGNWNGSGTANPATPAGGLSITPISSGPLYPLMNGGISDALTANFGDSAFSGTVPSGFTAGFPAAVAAGPRQSLIM